MDAAAPYEAHQLTRQGLDALLLAAAHRHRPDLTLPRELPDDVQSHPSVSEAGSKGYYIGPMAVFESQIIVPGNEPRICSDEDCIGNPVFVSTTAALLDAIEAMMDYLDVPSDKLDACLAAGPPFVTPQLMQVDDWQIYPAILPADPVRAHASWGLACFDACLRFARKTGSAIIRDE